MPLIIESEEEAQILNDGFERMIPVSIRQPVKGEAEIRGYASIEPELRLFFEEWKQEPIGREPLLRLRELLLPHFERWGYEDDVRHFDRYGCCYVKASTDKDGGGDDQKTFRVTRMKGKNEPCLLTFDFDALTKEGYMNRAVTENGQIVSAAITQAPFSFGQKKAEICVETARGYRDRGYATACVRELTSDLFSHGCQQVIYKCFYDNIRSASIAKKNGFVLSEKFFYYVLRKRKDRC